MDAVHKWPMCLSMLLPLILNPKMCLSQEEIVNVTEDYENDTVDYSLYVEMCTKAANLKFRLWFMPIFYSNICLIGLVGNLLVIITFLYFKRLRTMTNVYLLNLSLADLLFSLSLPFWAANSMTEWHLGLLVCKTMHTIYKVSFYSSMFTLCCISVDRYFAIAKAVIAHRHRAKAVFLSKISSVVIWVMALTLSSPEMIYTTIDNHTCTVYSSSDTQLPVVIQACQIFLGYVLPLLVMAFCYHSIIQTLCHAHSFERNKAVKIILIVVAVFAVCQTPYNVVLLWTTVVTARGGETDCHTDNTVLYVTDVTQAVAFLRCCLNPFVYAFIGVKFRYDLLKLLKDCGCMSPQMFLKCTGDSRTVLTTESETTTTF